MAEMARLLAALWRFPVKSMAGEELDSVEVSTQGLLGDRAMALFDVETGKVVTAKNVQLFPGLLDCRATFVEPPRSGRALPPVRITLPTGQSVASDAGDVDRVLSAHFHRDVRLTWAAPEDAPEDATPPDAPEDAPKDATRDTHPADRSGADPFGGRTRFVTPRVEYAFLAELGLPAMAPPGGFVDLFAVSVLTTSTLQRLTEVRPESRFDLRRFRMNMIIGSPESGFLENEWIGREVAIGDAVRLRVAVPDPRCVMTTLAQGDLEHDAEILRTVAQVNPLPVGAAGVYPCVGAYAVVEVPGTVRRGDRVSVR